MKKIFPFLLMLLFIASCGKESDDDDNGSNNIPNGFNYQGVFYNTENMGLFFAGDNEFIIYFTDATPVYNLPFCSQFFSGTNKTWLKINNFYSNVNGDIGNGNYVYNETENEGTFYTVGGEDFIRNMTFEECELIESSDNNPYIIGGNMSFTKNGLVYEVSYQFNMSNGEIITGSYKGERTFFWTS